LQAAGQSIGVQILNVRAGNERELDAAFAAVARGGAGALIVIASSYFNDLRERLIALAALHAIPTCFEAREFAESGGLMTYAASLTDAYRQVGSYAARILKGAKPAELPVMLPTRFELVLNLRTAKALGLTIPPGILAIADEVIE
jgi:ABC-type uncharacterized transport system substrate-binding protein